MTSMPYTAELRDRLLLAFLEEMQSSMCSPLYAFEHVRAITSVPLGTDLRAVDVAEHDDSVGIDMHSDQAGLEYASSIDRDVERVAFQVDYFGLWA